jgi:polar amino acid transport system substrate-binding protein
MPFARLLEVEVKRLRCAILITSLALSAPVDAALLRCVALNYPPIVSLDANGHAHGLAVDIVGAVLARMGHTLSVEVLPWTRALALVELGQRDCVLNLFHSAERARYLDYSHVSMLPQIIYFYARDDHAPQFEGDLGALAGRRVGTVLSVRYGQRFEAARANLRIQEVPTLEQNFRKLELGRIDLVPSNLYTASATLRGMAPAPAHVVKLARPLDSVDTFFALAKSRQLSPLREHFDRELTAFIASGAYQHLLAQYQIEITPELQRFLTARTLGH